MSQSNARPSLSDCYRTLGLVPGASADAVKDAFRKLSFKHHPDKAGSSQASNDRFAAIRQAYEDINDWLAEPKRGRWAENPGRGGGGGGFPGGGFPGGGWGFPADNPSRGYGFGYGGFPGSAPPPGYGSGRGGGPGAGRGYSPMDDPLFNEWFDTASEFMFGEKGRFPGGGSSGPRRRATSGAGFPPGGGSFPPGAGFPGGFTPGGFPPFGSSGGGMPPPVWDANFPPPGGAGPYSGRHGNWEPPFSGGSSSSRGQNRNPYNSGSGDNDDGPAPSREDPMGVVQWSLRRAHGRLAPLPGKLANMRKWWDKVGECGDLTSKQRAIGGQRFDQAEVHLAKMLSQVTGQMEAVRKHQQQDSASDNKKKKPKKGKGKEKESRWYNKMGSSSSKKNEKKKKKKKQGAPSKKQVDKLSAAAVRLGRSSEAVLNEIIALEVCAMNDNLDEFLAALGDIKSGGGNSHRTQQDDESSEDDESSSDEESSSEEDSSSESSDSESS